MSTTKKDIENALMRGADSLRDTIDAANYKDYVSRRRIKEIKERMGLK